MKFVNISINTDNTLYAHLSHDSRIYIHSLNSNAAAGSSSSSRSLASSSSNSVQQPRVYVDKNHLTHSFTCFAWSAEPTTSNSNDLKSTVNSNLLVVGCSDGMIIVWDLSRGVIIRTIHGAESDGAENTPNSIAISNDGTSIHVSYNDRNHIEQYDISSGKKIKSIKVGKKAVSKILMHPQLNVIAACSSSTIKIVDVDSGRKRKFVASLPGGVRALRFSRCGRFLSVASTRSRELLVFDVQADSRSDAPVYVVPVVGLIRAIDAKSPSYDVLEFLCIFDDSGAAIVRVSATYSEDRVHGVDSAVLTDIQSSTAIVAGTFGGMGNRAAQGIVLALGSETNPIFSFVDTEKHSVKLSASSDSSNRLIVLDNIQQLSIPSKTTEDYSSGTIIPINGVMLPPTMLGPHEMGGRKRPLIEGSVTAPDSSSSSSKKASTGSGSSPLDELTIEQRLEALSSSMTALERSSAKKTSAADAKPAPTSDSLVALIDQALQSGDDSLLEQCLSCSDPVVVEATTQRLPTSKVLLFLQKLVAKFEKRPSRGLLLTQWLSSALRWHTAYLLNVPDLAGQLAGLSQMLEQRLASYTRLSSLAGRLDVLMSQVSYRSIDADSRAGSSDVRPRHTITEEEEEH